jgi:hypothetical protein
MIDSKHSLNEIITRIDQELYDEASDLFLTAITDMKKESSPLLSKYYYEYGHFLFNLQEYEMSLLMLQSAYNLNYRCNEIEDFLYNSFILPNDMEFEDAYNRNILLYTNNIISTLIPSFDELPIDFIPYDENKYFIFNRDSKTFEGNIDISDELFNDYKKINFEDEFSDIVTSNNWNINSIKDLILSSKNRLVYFISSDIKKTLSFFKLPGIIDRFYSNVIFIDCLSTFQEYFHNNTDIYLPRLYYNNTSYSNNDNLLTIIKDEHQFRLTPQGRNTSNILLTIGIPSYNRGHRALKNILTLLESQYDAEIEFVISNNGSLENNKGYDEISKIPDSRINYFRFQENQGPNANFCQVLNISKGKYTCLLSDEDSIDIPAITHYLNVLKNNPNISFATSSGLFYYTHSSSQFFTAGKEAFLNSFLTTNYVTGLIYRTDLFHSLNMYKWTLDNMNVNKAVDYYGHSCWVMFFTLYGDFYEGNVILFKEGTAEEDQILTTINTPNISIPFLPYATLESRIEQHNGFIEVLNQLGKSIDFNTYITAYYFLCRKTFYLLSLVKEKYIDSGVDWNSLCNVLYSTCNDGITKLNMNLSEDTKNKLHEKINQVYLNYYKYD